MYTALIDLCMGIVKCLPFLLVSTAWLVLRWRKVILYALHSVFILSGVQLALGLDFICCNRTLCKTKGCL